ncbi:MAG: NADP oxidoreductase [Trueperaceae bacterium]|nr:NADP oxidoreductase [Trueperaceae bacterium]
MDLPLRVAVVGAGPAGFYATEALLKQRDDALVDVIDRLPAPFGLVRYGVAPDHLKIKAVTRVFERLLDDPRVRFLGGVEVGRELTADDLARHYHATVLAYGAAGDRRLGIPGEDLAGSLSATDFVGWYNGHPDLVDLEPPLDGPWAFVVGVGNVAVDVARILAKTPAELASSDIATHAAAALERSAVTDIVVLGRRGPAEAKWTTKELREFGELADADVVVDPAELDIMLASKAAIADDPAALRNLDVLADFAARPLAGRRRRVYLRFLRSPVAIEPDASGTRVGSIVIERNRLVERSGGVIGADGTGATERLPASLVLRSVGYRGRGLPGFPFDERRAVIPNERGRVLDEDGAVLPGVYVAGWIKRGPSGVIGTNKPDAVETATCLLEDPVRTIDAEAARPEAVDALLAGRGVTVLDRDGWRRIDAAETAAGEAAGRPRVKFVRREELMDAGR